MTASNVAKLPDRDASANAVAHVLTAINGVMEEVSREGISKDRNNQQQGYKFRGIDDVYNALAPLLSKHKLIITPRGLGRTSEERRTTNDKPIFYVNVEMEFELISALDGTRETAGPFYGEAMDSADKATNKAQSAAYKYMAMQQFCIPTEGDNDADATTIEPAPRRGPTAANMAINLLRGCGDPGMFKDAWEKNKDGWKRVLNDDEARRVWAVKDELIAKFKAEAEAAKPKPAPLDTNDPFSDEIPF